MFICIDSFAKVAKHSRDELCALGWTVRRECSGSSADRFLFFFFVCVCVCVLTLVASATLMKTATKLSVTAQLITFFFFHFFFFCLQHILHKRRLFSFIERQYLLSFSFFSLFALRWTHFRMPSMPS